MCSLREAIRWQKLLCFFSAQKSYPIHVSRRAAAPIFTVNPSQSERTEATNSPNVSTKCHRERMYLLHILIRHAKRVFRAIFFRQQDSARRLDAFELDIEWMCNFFSAGIIADDAPAEQWCCVFDGFLKEPVNDWYEDEYWWLSLRQDAFFATRSPVCAHVIWPSRKWVMENVQRWMHLADIPFHELLFYMLEEREGNCTIAHG